MPKRFAPRTYGAHEMIITAHPALPFRTNSGFARGFGGGPPELPVPQPRAQGTGRLGRYGKKHGSRAKRAPGAVDKLLSQTSMPGSLEKTEMTDGERWCEEMLEAELEEEYQMQMERAAEVEAEVAEEAEEDWELVESSPERERLLAPMPQPRTVVATALVSKRVAAFPVAATVMPAPVVRAAPVAPFLARPGAEDWNAKAARERARSRFLKDKAERAARAQKAQH